MFEFIPYTTNEIRLNFFSVIFMNVDLIGVIEPSTLVEYTNARV